MRSVRVDHNNAVGHSPNGYIRTAGNDQDMSFDTLKAMVIDIGHGCTASL